MILCSHERHVCTTGILLEAILLIILPCFMQMWILDIARHYKLPDVDLIITTSDGCPDPTGFTGNWTKCQRESPLFAYDSRDNETHCVRYPDHTMYSWPTAGLPSWQDVR